ncbi:MAG: beta strand repeat-containing protein, partial [Candidatus Kapaibacterium sp.]
MSAAQTSSDIPRVISYQAVLTDSAGVPVPDGDYSIGVTLYPASADRSLWRGTYLVHVARGIVNLFLGSGDYPLPNLSAEGSLWLGVRINGGDELPHTELTPSPYALNVVDSAVTTAKLANNAVTTSKIADSSITSSKVNMDYISSININGVQFTGHGTPLTIQGENGITAAYISDSNTLVLSGPNSKAPAPTWDPSNGGTGNSSSGTTDFIGGGVNDTIRTAAGETNANTITAGETNYIEEHSNHNSIGGGQNNTIYGFHRQTDWFDGDELSPTVTHNTIAGGNSNSIYNIDPDPYSGDSGNHRWNFIGGGYQNLINGDASVIGGGNSNAIDRIAVGGVIGGGESNYLGNYALTNLTHGDTDAAISGGRNNTIRGSISAIAGGANLKLGGYSFGFNADHTTVPPRITDLSDLGAGLSNVAYLGNVNLMIGNTDDTARKLKLYGPNTNLTYTPSATHYSSFQASASQTPYSIQYVLPPAQPSVNQELVATGDSLIGSTGNYLVTLGWASDTGAGGLAGWLLTGNSGTSPSAPNFNYLGTQDSEAFEIHVHNNTHDTTGGNQRVMRYSEGYTSPNILGGSSANILDTGLSGAAILSGGTLAAPNRIDTFASFSVIVAGSGNHIQGGPLANVVGGDSNATSTFGTIAGGENNQILRIGTFANGHTVIGGGQANIAQAEFDVIGGGRGNIMHVDTFRSGFNTIGGGDSNFVGYGSYDNTIGGGRLNWVANAYGTVGGGIGNLLNGPASLNTIGGGYFNEIGGDSSISAGYIWKSTIAGGDSNMIRQYASYSTIGGGSHNAIDSATTYATISGGASNEIEKGLEYGFIGGGLNNRIFDNYSVIGGGERNTIFDLVDLNAHSFIGGGLENSITSDFSVIGGGNWNGISTTEGGTNDVVVGGFADSIVGNAAFATVGGGSQNKILTESATIAGGSQNTIMATSINGGGTIGGGI